MFSQRQVGGRTAAAEAVESQCARGIRRDGSAGGHGRDSGAEGGEPWAERVSGGVEVVLSWDHARSARDHLVIHGNEAGGVEDGFFKFPFDLLFLSLLVDPLAFVFGYEAGVDVKA